jgi:hypothetical protein
MLKYTFETKDQELKAWVDPGNGSLIVEIGSEKIKVPHKAGLELVSVIKQKQSNFQEVERKKLSPWTKFYEMVTGHGKGGVWGASWSEI